MKVKNKMGPLLASMILGLGILTGCQQKSEPIEDAAESIENTAEDAAHETKQAAEEVGDEIKDATN